MSIRVLPTVVFKLEAFMVKANFFANGVSGVQTVTLGLEWYEKNFFVRIHGKKSKILPLAKNPNASWIRDLKKRLG